MDHVPSLVLVCIQMPFYLSYVNDCRLIYVLELGYQYCDLRLNIAWDSGYLLYHDTVLLFSPVFLCSEICENSQSTN